LGFLQRGDGAGLWSPRPGRACAFHRIDVKMVDDRDVVERGARLGRSRFVSR
jgi:hypothetical protein